MILEERFWHAVDQHRSRPWSASARDPTILGAPDTHPALCSASRVVHARDAFARARARSQQVAWCPRRSTPTSRASGACCSKRCSSSSSSTGCAGARLNPARRASGSTLGANAAVVRAPLAATLFVAASTRPIPRTRRPATSRASRRRECALVPRGGCAPPAWLGSANQPPGTRSSSTSRRVGGHSSLRLRRPAIGCFFSASTARSSAGEANLRKPSVDAQRRSAHLLPTALARFSCSGGGQAAVKPTARVVADIAPTCSGHSWFGLRRPI